MKLQKKIIEIMDRYCMNCLLPTYTHKVRSKAVEQILNTIYLEIEKNMPKEEYMLGEPLGRPGAIGFNQAIQQSKQAIKKTLGI